MLLVVSGNDFCPGGFVFHFASVAPRFCALDYRIVFPVTAVAQSEFRSHIDVALDVLLPRFHFLLSCRQRADYAFLFRHIELLPH